jgi:hypothetical protein
MKAINIKFNSNTVLLLLLNEPRDRIIRGFILVFDHDQCFRYYELIKTAIRLLLDLDAN